MIAVNSPLRPSRPARRVPDFLVYEIMDGQPIYYKGYRDVLSGKKTFSEIMGSSKLQSVIVTHLVILLGALLDDAHFTILASEAGLHLSKYTNLAGDVLIFDNARLPFETLDDHYADVPPRVVIEVDIAADTTQLTEDGYVHQKTQKLLDFGVQRVIWITTKSKKVMVATPDADWQIKDWHQDIEVMEGVTFNIGAYLRRKGSPFA